ncbi:hypothetical protein ACS0TY_001183 [Phlomoides rotata]
MSDVNNSNHMMENPPTSPSIPLQLCGFITGDTVQVDGDTGDLQFSVQFNVRKRERQSTDPFNFPDENIPEVEKFYDSVQSAPSSPYLTPTSTPEMNQDLNAVNERSLSRSCVVTRLRSGVLSPVKYCYRGIYSVSGGILGPHSQKKKKSNKCGGKCDNVFEKMLKRRCSPIRPCSPYAFFLVKNWGVVKRSSFVETSKRLSKQWCKLPSDKKKEYEEMSLKDNARYKRQCMLLRSDVEQQTTLDLLALCN